MVGLLPVAGFEMPVWAQKQRGYAFAIAKFIYPVIVFADNAIPYIVFLAVFLFLFPFSGVFDNENLVIIFRQERYSVVPSGDLVLAAIMSVALHQIDYFSAFHIIAQFAQPRHQRRLASGYLCVRWLGKLYEQLASVQRQIVPVCVAPLPYRAVIAGAVAAAGYAEKKKAHLQ
jgi:hypothetical protein